jgi:hypothetical protein
LVVSKELGWEHTRVEQKWHVVTVHF